MDQSNPVESTKAPPSNFLDQDGRPLWFNYHKIVHRGEHLPTIAKAIPAVWSDRNADRYAFFALWDWIDDRDRGAMIVFLLASIRCLTAIAKCSKYGGGKNGDNMGFAIEAAFDEIHSWPNRDPGATDEIDFIAESTFCEPPRKPKYDKWLTYYYIRWVKRAARRAIESERGKRRRLVSPPLDFDRAYYLGRTQKKNGSRHVLVRTDARDASQLAFSREIEKETDENLHDWMAGRDADGFLGSWLSAIVKDPVETAIIREKIDAPWRTHRQIIEIVNASLGTHHTHDKVSKCLRRAETNLKQKLESEFGFRPIKEPARRRAVGVAPYEPPVYGILCELPMGTIQAAAKYELDVDGYKIGPKILPRPNRQMPLHRKSA